MKLIKISAPGWEIDVKDEQEAAEKLWPWICGPCRDGWKYDDDVSEEPATENDLDSMLMSCCGCEFMLDDE